LSIFQLHILLSRTAQISLELHFCVELHAEKPWFTHPFIVQIIAEIYTSQRRIVLATVKCAVNFVLVAQ